MGESMKPATRDTRDLTERRPSRELFSDLIRAIHFGLTKIHLRHLVTAAAANRQSTSPSGWGIPPVA